jgi:uncharacterized Zn-binding protein involved in type VI secretion
MAGEIIRVGDKTSHGGVVIEGSQTDICMGKPIAFIGHMTHCPKCKGNYLIVEGVMTTTFYGKGVAVAGMKTSCGAVLVAGQFTDMVEWSAGPARSVPHSSNVSATRGAAASTLVDALASQHVSLESPDKDDDVEIEQFYTLTDEDGKPVDAYLYDLRVAGALHTKKGSYADGETVTINGNESIRLVTWLNKDGGSRA